MISRTSNLSLSDPRSWREKFCKILAYCFVPSWYFEDKDDAEGAPSPQHPQQIRDHARLFSDIIIHENVMNFEDVSSTLENGSNIEISAGFDAKERFCNDQLLGIGSEDDSHQSESDVEDLDSEEMSTSEGSDGSEGSSDDDDVLSQQNLFYFQNMDQLLNNYFASEDVNIVNAIQGLDKTIKEFNKSMKESMEQNAKCTLRVAKILETAVQVLKK